jgi:hypothetical protein
VLVRPPADRRRAAATARQRRYRARQKAGNMPTTIEVDAPIVAMLVETDWLREGDAGDRAKIGAALTAMLRDSAAKFR